MKTLRTRNCPAAGFGIGVSTSAKFSALGVPTGRLFKWISRLAALMISSSERALSHALRGDASRPARNVSRGWLDGAHALCPRRGAIRSLVVRRSLSGARGALATRPAATDVVVDAGD